MTACIKSNLYTGVPSEEGSELIGELLYQKPSIWNVYQAENIQA